MKLKILSFGCLIFLWLLKNEAMEVKFPDLPPLETERLILRKITLDDADDFFKFTSDTDVVKLTQMFELHTSKEEDTIPYLQRMINRYSISDGTAAYWAVVAKEDNRVIGIIGIFGYIKQHAKAEIGYALSKDKWNQGLTTEALQEVIRFCFEEMKLNRIQGGTDPENFGSIRVMEKNKMRLEGRLRELLIVHGKPSDRLIFSILKREYNL